METGTETTIGTSIETNIETNIDSITDIRQIGMNQNVSQMNFTKYTKYTEMVNHFFPFGIGCLLYGILFTISLYKGFHGITMPILAVVTGVGIIGCTSQQILDTKYQKIVSYTVRLYKPYVTLDIAPRNAGQVMPTI